MSTHVQHTERENKQDLYYQGLENRLQCDNTDTTLLVQLFTTSSPLCDPN